MFKWIAKSQAMPLLLAALSLPVAFSPAPAHADERCFAPGALQSRPREERIHQGTRRALVSLPATGGAPVAASPYRWTGVLRRVDLPPGRKVVALTFDLCEQPHEVAGYQGPIVDFLRQNQIKATFFAGGKWLLTHPERANQLVADQLFQTGNHTWEHRNLRILSGSALDDEIWHAQAAFRQVSAGLAEKQCVAPGRATGPSIFRFPFGACNPQAIAAVEAAGLRAIQWDVSAGDPSRSQTAERMVHDVVQQVHPGSIVLFHANGRGWNTTQAIPMIVAALRNQGYSFETVDGLLAIPGAKPVTTNICYDARPGDTDRYDSLARTLAEQHARAVAAIKAGAPVPQARVDAGGEPRRAPPRPVPAPLPWLVPKQP